jgi:uncharacterized membrane protein
MTPAPADNLEDDGKKGSVAKLEKKIIEANPRLFDGINRDQRKQIIQTLVLTLHKTHIGPLPDVETLEGYSNLIPDGADRVMRMAERQSEHRMELEKKVLEGQTRQSGVGQVLAFLIGLAALGASVYVIVQGAEWPGALIGVGGITGLVTAFIKGKDSQQQELRKNR